MSQCDDSGRQKKLIELYSKLADQPDSDFGWNKGKENARQLGYDDSWLNYFVDEIWQSAAAVGNPFKLVNISAGQTILDVGCGAGADSCIAALLTGHTGRVIGVDCTPAMLTKATKNSRLAQLSNIEFQLADISSLAIANQSIDLVISNGAINLSINKSTVFDELFRVLKPGGQLAIADMIRLSTDIDSAEETWENCVEGTLLIDDLINIIENSGFIQVECTELTHYKTSSNTSGALIRAVKPDAHSK